MGLGEAIPVHLDLVPGLLLAGGVGLLGVLVAMPKIIPKLHGAGITGRDINKPDRPVVAEMGGIGVFLAFNAGVFTLLLVHPLPATAQLLILVALITTAGAALTGVMDDLVELRQRFKAFIPMVFAAPLAVYLNDYTIRFPLVGSVDFMLLYPLVLVPVGIASASNSFNMLEGYNGLGAGMGLVMTVAMGLLVTWAGHPEALVILVPFGGALLGFLWFNLYPAKVFPGDTLTLLTGAVLAAAAMIGKVEFWGLLLFLPHIVEFVLKARGSFTGKNFADRVEPDPPRAPRLHYAGKVESLVHVPLKRFRMREPTMAYLFWGLEALLAALVLVAFVATRGGAA